MGLTYEVEYMKDPESAQQRAYAWYEQQIVDRVPIRFTEHNAMHNVDMSGILKNYKTIKDYWFDTEYHVTTFLDQYKEQPALAETFPTYYPNLGPGVYASYYGSTLDFAPVTSWTGRIVDDMETFDVESLQLNKESEYWKKIEEMTDTALAMCKGKALVGYTDLHPSVDCVSDWCGSEELCFAMMDMPDVVKAFTERAFRDFPAVYDHYCNRLMQDKKPCITWIGIPTAERMHMPSCDFSSLISDELFEEFVLPYVLKETELARYNIFHLDGPGVARHLDIILQVPQIQGIQVVQGVAEDEPMQQWVPMIKRIQAAGKSAILSIKLDELNDIMDALKPEGIYLTLACDYDLQPEVIKAVEKWK